jgi:hypothetical protein
MCMRKKQDCPVESQEPSPEWMDTPMKNLRHIQPIYRGPIADIISIPPHPIVLADTTVDLKLYIHDEEDIREVWISYNA